MSTVCVTKIALGTTENTISEFFSFCGKIVALKVTPAHDGDSLTALITFESASASKTSLLLSNALINDKPIVVNVAPEEIGRELAAEPLAAKNPNIVNKADVPEGVRTATSTIATILAAGYKLSADAAEKAKELDSATGFSQKVSNLAAAASEKVSEVDQQYGISERVQSAAAAVGERLSAIDAQYHISENATAAAQQASAVLGGIARSTAAGIEAVATQAGQAIESSMPGTVAKVKEATGTVSAVASNLQEETKAKIAATTGGQYSHDDQASKDAKPSDTARSNNAVLMSELKSADINLAHVDPSKIHDASDPTAALEQDKLLNEIKQGDHNLNHVDPSKVHDASTPAAAIEKGKLLNEIERGNVSLAHVEGTKVHDASAPVTFGTTSAAPTFGSTGSVGAPVQTTSPFVTQS